MAAIKANALKYAAANRKPKQKRRPKQPNPGFVGTTKDVLATPPVRRGFVIGNNVPKFGPCKSLGTLPGMMMRTHAVSAPFAVTAVGGGQTPANQTGYCLVNPSRLWTIGTFVTFPINAVLGASTATIVALFQYFVIKRLRVRYLPDNAGGTAANGNVCLAWQADPNQAVPTSIPEMSNNSVSVTTPVWREAQIVVDPGSLPTNLREAYQIGTSATAASSDYHMGAIYVAAENVGVAGDSSSVLFNCGRLEVEAELYLWGITA